MAAAKWSDVEANPKYQALSDAGKTELKTRYWNNVVAAAPQYQALGDDGRNQLHKRFFGVLPGEITQTEPQDNVDRTDRGIGSDLAGAWTEGANQLVAGAGWVMKAAGADKVGQSVMNVGEKGMKAGSDMMSKEGIEAGKKKFLTTNWDESVLTNPRALAIASVESLPGMVIPMGATAGVARAAASVAAKKAGEIAAQRGASAAVTQRFMSKAAADAMKKAVIPASIVGETAVSSSSVGQQTYDEVMGMKPEDLEAKSQTYRETVKHYVDNGLSEEEARGLAQEAVAMSASRIAATVSAPVSAVAGVIGGKQMGRWLGEERTTVGKEAARGAATEIAQEVPQSAAEQFGQNAGVKIEADPTRNLGKDVLEQALMGGVTAAPMGGGFGALHGMGGKGDEKPAPDGAPGADQPAGPTAADIPSDALRQRTADLAGSSSEWDAKVRDEINTELTRRGEQPVEPPAAAAQADATSEQPAAAPATNEVPGHVGYDLEQMNAQQQPAAPAPGLGGIADRAQQHPAMQVPDNVDPKTGEVIDQLPALNDTQLVEEVRGMMAAGAPPLAKEIAEKFGIDRERAGRVLNAAWAVTKQDPVDTAPVAAPAAAPAATAVPATSEFPTMHLAQQALAGSGQAETHRVVPKGARFVIEPKPAAQPEAVADAATVEQPAAPAVAEQAPSAAPVAADGAASVPTETQQDPVAEAKAALAAHRATNPAKGQGKAWAAQEKALQEAIRSARKTANAAPTAQQPVATPELPEINFRADREAALAAKAAGAQAETAPEAAAPEWNAEKFSALYRDEYAKQYPNHPMSAEFLNERGEQFRKAVEAKDSEALRSLNIGDREANPVLRRAFEAVTGVKLPAGRGASLQAVDRWAGVSEEERAKRDAGKKAASEEKSAQGALGAARRQAAAITVNSPEGKSEAGDKYVDRLISEGYDYLHKRKKGASYTTYLANRATDMALPMTHKALAEYARLAAAENAARPKPEAVAAPEPAPTAKAPAAAEGKSQGAKPDVTESTAKPEQPASKIEDFGETLHGARKHYAQAYKDQIAASESIDMAVEPLSKSWPEPDYQKLLDDGVDPWIVAFVRVNRDAIPTKPKKGWKLQGWAAGANVLRDSAHKALRGEHTADQIKEVMAKDRFNRSSQKINGIIDLYLAVGHEKSLKGIDFSLSHYSLHGGVKYSPPKAIWTVSRESKSTAFGNWPTELALGDTREEVIAAFKAKYATMDAPAAKKAEVKFTIYSRTTDDPRKFYIGKKVGKTYFDLKSFATSKEARDFLEGNHDELVRLLANNKEIPPERRETNDPRVGVDHRGGADVTPEHFSETFGFRGVQFGNYVEGSRRQQDLNNAYDALMDLAGVIGVPPKALSLNGELGLAFGARGKGGARPAAAHYESGTVVINLTKGAGAGSLAHEWWHSVDNYFSRMRQGAGRNYMTDSRDVSLAARGSNFVAAPGVRKEVVQAFGDIMRGINRTSVKERSKNLDSRRTKAYWSTDIEMSARAFESYVIAKLQDQGASNDYLANIVSEEAWGLEEGYPYPTAGEIADIRAGFDTFFNVVQTKATDKGVAMFSVGQGDKVGMPAKTIRNMIDRMKAGAAGIVVRQSAKDLPPAVLAAADKQGIPHDKIRGVHFGGVSYLVADNLTAKEVQAVVFHEAYVHGGLRARYEGRVESRMIDLANNLQGGGKPYVRVMRLAKQQGINLIAYERGLESDSTKSERQKLAVLTEELMAHVGETTGSLRAYLEEVVGMIRKFLRDVGLANLSEMGITDIRAELRAAREAYLNQAAEASGEPVFSRAGPTVGKGAGDTLQANNGGIAYKHEIRPLDQLLLDANSSLHLNGRGRVGLVEQEWTQPSRYAGERGGQGGSAVQGATSARAGREEQARLVAAAKEHGFFIGLGHPIFESLESYDNKGGEEHDTYIVGEARNRVVIRHTLRGEFGNTSQYSPAQYMKRLEEYNQTFPTLQTRMIGVHEDADGLVSIFTAQQFVQGEEFATQKELDAAMRANGWFTLGMNDYEYTHKDTGAVIGDAHTGNVLHIGNKLFPIDVIVEKMPKASGGKIDDAPMFSLRGDSGKAQTSTVTNLRAWLRNQLAIRTQSSRTFNLLWHRGVGTQYHKATIDKHYKRVYDIGQEYLNGVARNAADSMEAAPTLLGRMDGLKDWWRDAKSSVTSSQDKKDLAAIAGPIFDGTLKDKKQYTDQELKKQFGLTDKQVGLYREFRNAVEVSLHSLAKAEIYDRLKASKSLPKEVLDTLRDMDVDMDTFTKHVRSELAKHLKAHDGDADVKKAVAAGLSSVKDINERINNLLNEGYAPLMRFGEYTVTVKDKAGKVEHFSMHESQAEANAAKAALEKEVPKSYTVESGVMAEGEHEMFKGISPETIALFGEAAGITKDEAYQEYLKKAVANRSALKRLIHRKEVPGFDKDVQRVLASFVTSNARRAAKLTHLDQLDEAIEAIPQKKGDVKTEAIKFRKYMLDTGNEAQKLRGALFTYYITGSIASAAVNLTQPITMTFPYLSRWGSTRAAKELARATKDAVASFGGTVPADIESAYNRAKRDGVVDPQNIFNMMAMAEGTLTAEGAASRSLKALNHSLAIAFSSAEALNRKSAFIAAFRIGRDLNKAQMEKAGVSSAYEFAVKAVTDTQGVYNRGNRPNIGRGAVGATVMTFKQFSISYVEFLRRLWKDDKGSFLIAIGILQMLAGAMGQPFADDIEDVVGSVMSRIGFGENPESKLRSVAQETFGDKWAEFMLYGSSAVLPIDVHGRLGMGNLIPATGIANKFNSPAQQTREMLEVAGVAGGLAQSVISGQAVPAFARNAAKGAEMISTGEYRDTQGRKVMDASVGEGVAKMLGFQPSSVARETRALGAEMERVNAQRTMESEFADRRAAAIVDGDAKALKQVLADTAAWNERNPKQRIVITGAQVTKRVREMKKSREERFLKRVPKEMRGDMRDRMTQ